MDPDAKIKKSEEEMRRLKGEQDSLQGKIEQTDQAASQLQQDGSAQTGQEAQQSQQSGPPQQHDGKAAQAAELSNAKSSYESLLSQVKVEYLSAEEARKVAGEEKFQADKAAEESQKFSGSAQFQNVDQALNADGGEKAKLGNTWGAQTQEVVPEEVALKQKESASEKMITEDSGLRETQLGAQAKEQEDDDLYQELDEDTIDGVHDAAEEIGEEIKAQHEEHGGPDGGSSHGPNPDFPGGNDGGIPRPDLGNTRTEVRQEGAPPPDMPHNEYGQVGNEVVMAVTAAWAIQKLREGGKEAPEEKPGKGILEPHDLSGEQRAAEKLKDSYGFDAKPFDEKAARMNELFAEQDQSRHDHREYRSQKAEADFAAIHDENNTSQVGYDQDRKQLMSDIQGARQAEDEKVQEWRSGFVNGMCKEEADKQITQDNKDAMKRYDQRLEDLGKEAHPALRENAKNMLEANAPEKIEQRTTELQEKHFPEIPSPSVESPSLGSPSVSAPAVEAPALSTPGSGPGGGR